jgi:hypothetical protein
MSQQPYVVLIHLFQFDVQWKILDHLLIAVLVLATKLHNSALLLHISCVLCTFLRYWIYMVTKHSLITSKYVCLKHVMTAQSIYGISSQWKWKCVFFCIFWYFRSNVILVYTCYRSFDQHNYCACICSKTLVLKIGSRY